MQLAGARPDAVEHLARHEPAGGPDGDAGGDAALEAGDPHHEELVEVAGEDGEELGPLEQRQVGVLGQLEHPLVEGEPGQLAVEEPVLGQRERSRLLGREAAPSSAARVPRQDVDRPSHHDYRRRPRGATADGDAGGGAEAPNITSVSSGRNRGLVQRDRGGLSGVDVQHRVRQLERPRRWAGRRVSGPGRARARGRRGRRRRRRPRRSGVPVAGGVRGERVCDASCSSPVSACASRGCSCGPRRRRAPSSSGSRPPLTAGAVVAT